MEVALTTCPNKDVLFFESQQSEGHDDWPRVWVDISQNVAAIWRTLLSQWSGVGLGAGSGWERTMRRSGV